MKRLGMVVALAAAAMGGVGAAQAADTFTINLPSAPPAVPLPPPPGFTFAGPYVGTYGGMVLNEFYQAGLQGGFNFLRGPLLVGAEAQLGAVFDGAFRFAGDLNARLGVVLGERILIYGEAGVGIAAGTLLYTAGGGVEIGIGQSISIFGEAKGIASFGNPFSTLTVQGGINWHPNY